MKYAVIGLVVCLAAGCCAGMFTYAQQSETDKKATDKDSQTQMGSEEMMQKMMQKMMARMEDNPMMSQCQNMMCMVLFTDSPGSLCALRDQLGLSAEQVKKLNDIEDKARAEAKGVLTDEQRNKLEEITKNWESQSMMQKMRVMMPEMQKMMGGKMLCPMMQMMQKDEEKNSSTQDKDLK